MKDNMGSSGGAHAPQKDGFVDSAQPRTRAARLVCTRDAEGVATIEVGSGEMQVNAAVGILFLGLTLLCGFHGTDES